MLRKVFDSGDIALEMELDSIDDLLPRESEILLYRVAQESVNNIVKHSRATRARILVKRSGDGRSLSLTFEDNGCGFDPAAQPDPNKRSFGLTGIAERARLLVGGHTIVYAIGKGTTVTIRIDLAHGTHETTTARADR
jgi:signal transduction histidine kinase